ncbi:hypothetical protein HDU76_009852 [Blyttiomyces sp. JEL0837]|nr:hypothetical protein HDU76_009852 [Blyttiomyces sp. JEL0837]
MDPTIEYPNVICVGARTISIQTDRIIQSYRAIILNKTEGAKGFGDAEPGIVAEGRAVIVTFDHLAKKKARVPPEVISAIEKAEGSSKLD